MDMKVTQTFRAYFDKETMMEKAKQPGPIERTHYGPPRLAQTHHEARRIPAAG